MESVQDRHVFTVASVFALTSNTTFLLFKDMWWERERNTQILVISWSGPIYIRVEYR
jgi:hypothetical protein